LRRYAAASSGAAKDALAAGVAGRRTPRLAQPRAGPRL